MKATPRATRLYYFDVGCVEYVDRYIERIPAARYFDHRALLIADEPDFVLLNSPVDRAYLSYLKGFGLGPAAARVFCVSDFPHDRVGAIAAALRTEGAQVCSLLPYRHHCTISNLAAELRKRVPVRVDYPERAIDPARRYSSKAEGRKLAEELGLPLSEAILMEADADAIVGAVRQRFSREDPLIIKGLWGNSGSETRKLAAPWNEQLLRDELSTWGRNCPVIIEASIEQHLATNVMVRICEETGAIEVLGISDQLIAEGTRHVGNQFPSRSLHQMEIAKAAIEIAESLRIEGFCGYAGVDFIETLPIAGVVPRYHFLEVNPRVNASLHPLLVMRKLNMMHGAQGNPEVCAFRQLSFPLPDRSFAEILDLLGPEAFDPRTGRGLILYSPSFLRAGSLFVMLLGQAEEDLNRLHASLFTRLGIRS